jgi:glycosyltransferase involved in cell wall biosynthesis
LTTRSLKGSILTSWEVGVVEAPGVTSVVPRVAIVIATHRRPALLAEALESVAAQTFRDVETVVAEDGGTEETARIVAASGAPGVRHVPLAFCGRHGAVRNEALRQVSSPLVAFLDDDDLWLPRRLEVHVAALEAVPSAGLVFGPVRRFGEREGTWPRHVPPRVDLALLLRGNCVPLSSVLARREALEGAGLFPESTEATPDYELWLRVARSRLLVGHPEPLVRYRVHAGGMSRRKALEVEELAALLTRLESEWDLPPRLLSPARRGLLRSRARLAPGLGEAIRLRALSLAPGPVLRG